MFLEPEKELRTQQKKKGSAIQIITPQNAYIMTDMLKRTVTDGTLAYPTANGRLFTYKDEEGKKFILPAAGKTGTTQNWADAWTIGFTPYVTNRCLVRFRPSRKFSGHHPIGRRHRGRPMGQLHGSHPPRPSLQGFHPSHQSGLVDVPVCSKSGLLPTEHCNEGLVTLTFYEGTQPHQYCDLHQFSSEAAERGMHTLSRQGSLFGNEVEVDTTLTLDLPGLESLLSPPPASPAPTGTTPNAPPSSTTDEASPSSVLE